MSFKKTQIAGRRQIEKRSWTALWCVEQIGDAASNVWMLKCKAEQNFVAVWAWNAFRYQNEFCTLCGDGKPGKQEVEIIQQ